MSYYPDISHWKPVSNWAAVKQSCPFIISKATQGTKYVDPYLDTFIKNCEANAIPYWLYTFLEKGNEKAQAEFLVKTLKGKTGERFVGYILDIEQGNTAANVKTAYDYLRTQGKKVMLYTMYAQYSIYKNVIEMRDANTAWWEARYGYNTGYVSMSGHEGADLHQYTSKGTCPGIKGEVDLNRLVGTKSEKWFTMRETVVVPEKKKEEKTMAVLVGSARIDERGRASGGLAGDQTGKEVATETWYKHPQGWYVLRPKNAKDAEKIAHAMEEACKNANIGYDQGQRLSLYNFAKNVGFDPAKVNSKCETDCSALVRVCLAYAGIHVANFVTTNEKSVLMATGKFELRPDKESKSAAYAKRGDILVTKTKGHTVIVLGNGANASKSAETPKVVETSKTKTIKATEPAKSKSSACNRSFTTNAKCHIRNGAGVTKKSLGIIPINTAVRCYGYYTYAGGRNWYYVVVTVNGITYTGYISGKCLIGG